MFYFHAFGRNISIAVDGVKIMAFDGKVFPPAHSVDNFQDFFSIFSHKFLESKAEITHLLNNFIF